MSYKEKIEQTFNTVAGGYDHPSLAFFPETAECMMNVLDLKSSARLLDVCTGTGRVALNAALRLKQGRVTGADLSHGMLQQARMKSEKLGLDNVNFMQMDLDDLDIPKNSFDIVACSFGLFFLENMEIAMKNIVATVKPAGKIAISSFTGNAFQPFSEMFINRYISFGMEAPPLSWKRLATEDEITAVYNSAGIDSIKFYHERLTYPIENEHKWWDVVWNAGYRGLLDQLTKQQQIEFREKHLAEIKAFCEKEETWMDVNVIIAIGHKN